MNIQRAAGLALITAVISGVSNFTAKIGVTVVSDPVVWTFLKNTVVGALLIGILILCAKVKEVRSLSRSTWLKLAVIGVVGGSIPFILFFTGLTMTSALSGSLIHKTLFIWVALLAVPLLKEKIGALQGAAFLLLIFGNFALGGLNNFHWGTGELMILAATLLWAAENIIAKRVLANVSSLTVAGARMVFGSVLLFGVVLWQGNLSLMAGLTGQQWLWTLIPAALLLGYVTTWYAALKDAPATLVASLLVPATLVTNILSQIFLEKTMTTEQVMSGVAVIIAVCLLLWEVRNISMKKRAHAVSR